MSDVWKIGQKVNADEYYNDAKKGKIHTPDGEISGFRAGGLGEVFAAKQIARICTEMSKSYDEVIDEQNEYLLEVEEINNEIVKLQEQLEAEVEAKEAEIKDLYTKVEDDGTLSEENQNAILTKRGELTDIHAEFGSIIDTKSAQLKTTTSDAENTRSKETIATEYGEKAIEKGQPLAETKDKRKSFWRKLSGSWDQSAKREAGKAAVDAGNELLSQVDLSKTIGDEIDKKTKKMKNYSL